MDNATKIEHFRNLISLSAADGKIEDAERVALSKIAYERNIPLDRMNIMLARAHEYSFLIPQNKAERELQLEEMIEFALIDGELAKAEVDLIHVVGEKLGFTTSQIDHFIQKQVGVKV
jgi:uncharacterized tellurite resistance protein B-like protein